MTKYQFTQHAYSDKHSSTGECIPERKVKFVRPQEVEHSGQKKDSQQDADGLQWTRGALHGLTTAYVPIRAVSGSASGSEGSEINEIAVSSPDRYWERRSPLVDGPPATATASGPSRRC
jgi:hypothetical protein